MVQKIRETTSTLADVIDVVLDRGLIINADIIVSVAGVELLGIKIRAALASFATAARYGLEFPSGTNLETAAWNTGHAANGGGQEIDQDEIGVVKEIGEKAEAGTEDE